MTDYQTQIKEHLSTYKTKRLGVQENGVWEKNNRDYPHILPKPLYRLNILETYRKEFWEYLYEREYIKLHQNFHHINSSQAMCFNLFFPFLFNDGARKIFLTDILLSTNKNITECEFEKVLNQKEGTNFDFFIAFETGDRWFFEIKFTENNFGSARPDKSHMEKYNKIYKPGLDDKVKKESLRPSTFFKNYQIFRNIYYLNQHSEDRLFFIFPKQNAKLSKKAGFVKHILTDKIKEKVSIVYLEDIIHKIQSSQLISLTVKAHYTLFTEKYVPEELTSAKIETVSDFSG